METVKLICSQPEFNTEFERCCREYSHLEMFTAWVGNPGNILPYSHLENLDKVEIHFGISFCQSSPAGIQYLMDKKYKLTIVDYDATYHPKLYFFKSVDKIALLIGSSNFTYSGFFENIEANVLLEGGRMTDEIQGYLSEVKALLANITTFQPTKSWLNDYQKKYDVRQKKLKTNKIIDESSKEDKLILSSSWLAKADWITYLKHIKKGLKNHESLYEETFSNKTDLFKEYEVHLKTPWNVTLFDTIDNRRMLLGIRKYAWLGHIGASGRIQQLLASGKKSKKTTIINAINSIAHLQFPLDYAILTKELEKLEKLGPSMKVWGRLLAIVRPDLYCTISSEKVRESLSSLLGKPKTYFETIGGYIELLKLIHQSPWYNSPQPTVKTEQEIWKRRVAFLDVIFY